MNKLFLDAGYLIALEASDDQYHNIAIEYWKDFRSAPVPLVTTTFVFDEVVTFLTIVRATQKLLRSETSFCKVTSSN
jgi:predicted nucleic acid-binding protein